MDKPKLPGSGRAAVHDHRIRILPFLVRNERRACGDKQNPEWSKSGAFDGDKAEFIENVRKALFASKIVSYAQGFAQLRVASDEYGWNLQYGNLAKIWRGGRIIRSRFLQNITDAYENNPELKNLPLDPFFTDIIESYQDAWRKVVASAVSLGIPVPGFSSALAYYDSYRTANLPANLPQAQRDYFGAHTFKRVDKEGTFHYNWMD